METEMQRLMPLPNPSAAASSSSDEARYTSLKDIIIASPAPPCPRDLASRAASMHDFYGFDAASIPIRNHLLKHAASAYLQSAANQWRNQGGASGGFSPPLAPEKLFTVPSSTSTSDPSSLKLAIAIALQPLLRSKNLNFSSSSHSDAQRWRQKAKERKREIQRLREEFKQLEDGMRSEVVPHIAACRCQFFDGCGKLSPRSGQIGREGLWIDEVLRRRFLRLMRWKERRRKLDDSVRKRHFIELNSEDEIGKLNTSIDFLVELCNGKFVENDSSFRALSHEAVDFILESLASATDADFCVQHLIRKLGDEPFIGQRVVLSVSQKICIQVDSLP